MHAGDILIVDDNPINLDLLGGILREHGYLARVANDGRRALSVVHELAPELILLDISMPGMDGFDVCRELKRDPATRDIPVIFISALDDVLDKVRAFKTGGVDYVTKPFHAEEVVARVENQLQIARLRATIEAHERDLERRNAELLAKNEELLASRKRTDRIFSALSELLPGSVLDEKYRLGSKIGAGGYGAVYRATHLGLNRPVAVKIFRPTEGSDTPEELERFRREGVAACRITHPNAVTVFDSGISESGIAYLVMELLEGHTLTRELADGEPLSPARCAEIVIPVCEALAAAHAEGLVHRDVKPDNIFLHRGSVGEVVKVVDFGIAKLLRSSADESDVEITMSGWTVGTPYYIAPERIRHEKYDGRSDVYSVGVLLYQMLSGRLPFPKDGTSVVGYLARALREEPTPLRAVRPDVSTELEAIVMRALAKDASRRPTAGELARALADSTGVEWRESTAEHRTSGVRPPVVSFDAPTERLPEVNEPGREG